MSRRGLRKGEDRIFKALSFMRRFGVPLVNSGNELRMLKAKDVRKGDFVGRRSRGGGEARGWEVIDIEDGQAQVHARNGGRALVGLKDDGYFFAFRVAKPWWEVNKQLAADRRRYKRERELLKYKYRHSLFHKRLGTYGE